jgi:LPXTG-site transpeptidase (sortase) family protein
VPDLEVAAQVYPDVHTEALEAGAAWVSATTPPGKRGNIAIAGHRDSFFRALENIPLGTRISLTTAERELLFTVTDVEIVDPLDTSPLAPTETTTLTLITCHPFRYQGYAPDRYIIRAEILEDSQTQTEPAESALRTIPAT